MNRFAAMKQISFEQNLQEDILSVYNNPSLLQFMIFSLVNELLETLESGSAIRFFSSMRGQDIKIIIESGSAPVGNGDELVGSGQMSQILDFAAEKMNIAVIRQFSEGGCLKITLTLPVG